MNLKNCIQIKNRCSVLKACFDLNSLYEELEESCIPSYCHPNLLLAAVAWWRLIAASELYRNFASPGPILDFGAATGELYHFLPPENTYHFIERNILLSSALRSFNPSAKPESLEGLPPARFSAIFALDSLEHNVDVPSIIDQLYASLQNDGFMVVSGPTENMLYRFGRRVAGFSGHYHKMTIYDIETLLNKSLKRRYLISGPFHLPLFRVSVWQKSRK